MNLKTCLVDYLASFEPAVPSLGAAATAARKPFHEVMERVSHWNRVAFWICLAALLILLTASIVLSLVFGLEIGELPAGGVQAALGVTSGGVVVMLLRFARDHTRSDVLLAAMVELRDIDEERFAALVFDLAVRWYGQDAVPTAKALPAPVPSKA